MKARTIPYSVRALALGTLLAASPLSFAAEPSGNKSTAKDIAKKADETSRAIKNYTVAQREEAIKNAKAALDELRRERNEAAEWYGGLKHSSAESWEQVKTGFVKSYEVLKESFAKARKGF